MKISRSTDFHNTLRLLKFFSVAILLFISFNGVSQGLINDGAYITNSAAYIYIQGGSGLGNFTNKDNGGFIGKVNNSGFIDVTGNWTNNSAQNVFTANTGAVELLGSNQDLGGATATWFNNLYLLGSGTKTLQIDELVGGGYSSPAGILALNDRPLALNTHTLTVNNPLNSAITRTSGYIISESNAANNTSIIEWNVGALNAAYIFPFGTSSSPNYIPLTITKTAGSTNILTSTRQTFTTDNQPWQFTVSNMWSSVVLGNGEVPVVIDRWWDINATAAFTGAVDFTYRGVENTTTYAPTTNFSAQNWVGYWTPPVGTGPGILSGTAVVSIPAQTLGNTTPWVLSNLDAPLPIKLLSFDAKADGQIVHLSWSTASEINNDFFEVQRSKDNSLFEKIDIVDGAGNSTAAINYSNVDSKPYSGISYYRLRQVDFDGKFSFSNSIPVRIGNEKGFEFLFASPAEASKNIVIGFSADKKESVNVRITDMLGNLIASIIIDSAEGFNKNEIHLPELPSDIYTITLTTSGYNVSKKLFIN